MASLLPLRLICGSMFLLFTVLGTALSFPLSPLDEMKMYWTQNRCVFPPPPLYLPESDLILWKAEFPVTPVPPVLQACEKPDPGFHETLCSTFFNISKALCRYNDEHLRADDLAKSVHDVTWDVCSNAEFIGMPAIFGFITMDSAVCKRQCEENPELAPVCKWLIAAVVRITEVKAERAAKQGGTTGQQQATAQVTRNDHPASASENSEILNGTVPQDADSKGARAGAEPQTREGTPPLKNVPDANKTNEQKTTSDNVLTNSNVAKLPVSIKATEHPRAGAKQGGTTGQQQATAQVTRNDHPASASENSGIPNGIVPQEADSKGARAGTEPQTREGTPPLKNVPDANKTSEQKSISENVLTNSNVAKLPVSTKATERPRAAEKSEGDLTPGPQTVKAQSLLEKGPQPSSTTPSTPLTSKWGELGDKGGDEKSRGQDQEGSGNQTKNDLNPPSPVNETEPSQVALNASSQVKKDQHSPVNTDQPSPVNTDQPSPVDQNSILVGRQDPEDGDSPSKSNSGVQDEAPSGHFMAYFVTAVVLCVAGYVIYHNKKKIFAFVLEGRREGQQRRRSSAGSSSGGSSAKYHKLTPSVEEVMPSLEKSTASTNYIY